VWTTTNIAAAHILRDLGRVEVEEGVGCAAVFSAPPGVFSPPPPHFAHSSHSSIHRTQPASHRGHLSPRQPQCVTRSDSQTVRHK
jgi:hypothetical protein